MTEVMDVALKRQEAMERRLSRRQFLVVGAGAAGALTALVASPAHADIVDTLGKILYLDPIVVNFAFEMETLESDFFNRAVQSRAYELLSEDEKGVISLLAREDNEHVQTIDHLREQYQYKPAGGMETRNSSHAYMPPIFHFPHKAFRSRDALLDEARSIKEAALFAYHGAVPLVHDKKILSVAASIAGVEGRHAAVLREICGLDPVPSPFESAVSPQKIGNQLARYGFMGGGMRP